MEKGFYKLEGEELFFAPNFVECSEYIIRIEEKDDYIYPIFGWRYFETEEEAKNFYNL